MPSSEPTLLQRIYDVGERMQAALYNDDLDTFFQLTEQRGTLIDDLQAFTHPREIDPDWHDVADALEEQQVAINEALATQEQRLADALNNRERFKEARQQYHSSAPRSRILRQNLRV